MIVYESYFAGLATLRRVHGSAAYRMVLPAAVSTALLCVYHYFLLRNGNENVVQHPYAIGAFVAFFSFLLTFRLNFAYERYWEAATAAHQMLSKWLDCAVTLAAFHYQARQFDDIKPPSLYGRYGADLGRTRTKTGEGEGESLPAREAISMESFLFSRPFWKALFRQKHRKPSDLSEREDREARRFAKSINPPTRSTNPARFSITAQSTPKQMVRQGPNRATRIPIPQRFQERFTSRERLMQQQREQRTLLDFLEAQRRGTRIPSPSLFLQEATHLMSLLSAVALSTLRSDVEAAYTPLTEYIPGKPWPPADADQELRTKMGRWNHYTQIVYFLLGWRRSQRYRTLYNAARPLAVLGGVSDDEVRLLQEARGPYAKVMLVTMWYQEFLSREYIAGSTGDVAPPIISRLYQMLSDGVVGYNQARKVAYIPYPFPSGQIAVFFCVVSIFIFPLLYESFVSNLPLAGAMNFCTVLCFLGIHQVARELENPFQNVPNDLPLRLFQAQFNEALVSVYAGFHPDDANFESWNPPFQDVSLRNSSDDERERPWGFRLFRRF